MCHRPPLREGVSISVQPSACDRAEHAKTYYEVCSIDHRERSYVMYANCSHNIEEALIARALSGPCRDVNGKKEFYEPDLPENVTARERLNRTFVKLLERTSKQFSDPVPYIKPQNLYLHFDNPKQRRRVESGIAQLEHYKYFEDKKVTVYMETFVKKEIYPFGTSSFDHGIETFDPTPKPPRAIYACPDWLFVSAACMFKKFEHNMFETQGWANDKLFQHTPMVGKGHNLESKAEILLKQRSMFQNPVTIGLDITRFERSMHGDYSNILLSTIRLSKAPKKTKNTHA